MTAPKICVVGCGYWGKNLLRTFATLQCLYGFHDADSELANRMASSYPGTKAFHDFQAVLDDNEVDAVALATPAECHYSLAMSALAAGAKGTITRTGRDG